MYSNIDLNSYIPMQAALRVVLFYELFHGGLKLSIKSNLINTMPLF